MKRITAILLMTILCMGAQAGEKSPDTRELLAAMMREDSNRAEKARIEQALLKAQQYVVKAALRDDNTVLLLSGNVAVVLEGIQLDIPAGSGVDIKKNTAFIRDRKYRVLQCIVLEKQATEDK